MRKYKQLAAATCAAVMLLLASCSDNNTDAAHNEQDTNLTDTRRFTDTTSNYIMDDSAGINQTPASGGTGLDQ